MTDLMTTLQPTSPTAIEAAPAVAEPTLITEQQVMFSTAAAVAPQPARPVLDRCDRVVRRSAAAAADPPEPVRRHHSERYAYLQNALMSREMVSAVDQLAKGTGLTTAEYAEASPTTERLCRPNTSTGTSPARVMRCRSRYWSRSRRRRSAGWPGCPRSPGRRAPAPAHRVLQPGHRALEQVEDVGGVVGVQADEPLDEVTGQQRALAGLRVHPDQRVLGLEHLGDELVAVGLLGDVDAADALLVTLGGVVVQVGVHRPQTLDQRLQRRGQRS